MLEQGQCKPTPKTLENLSRALGRPLSADSVKAENEDEIPDVDVATLRLIEEGLLKKRINEVELRKISDAPMLVGGSEKRTETLTIDLAAETLAALDDAAAFDGVETSVWVQRKIIEFLEQKKVAAAAMRANRRTG